MKDDFKEHNKKPILFESEELTEEQWINESLFEIHRFLLESMGISDEVSFNADRIISWIRKTVNQLPTIRKTSNGTVVKGAAFKRYVYNTEVDVRLTYVDYPSKEVYENEYLELGNLETMEKASKQFLNIKVEAIAGTIIEDSVSDSVQHELEHFYQELKIGKDFSDRSYYRRILDFKRSNDPVERTIGDLMYLCYKPEQEAYANGLYAYLKAMKPQGDFDVFDIGADCSMIKGYIKFKEYTNFVRKHRDNRQILNAIKDFGFSGFEKFDKVITDGFNTYVYRIQRTYLKYIEDRKAGRLVEINEYIESMHR